MKERAKRKNIIITNTEKGGAVEKYICETNCQLSDKRNWTLQDDSTLQHSKTVNDTFSRSLLFIKLASVNPKTPKFHVSSKRYKKNNQGRPVINSVNCHTSEISHFVDYHIQPLVRGIPSYIKERYDFKKTFKIFLFHLTHCL